MYTLVIVDDEPLVRLALHRMIDWPSLGIRVVGEAGDGEEALGLLLAMGGADLLLVDIEMPRMGGIELLRRCAEEAALSRRPLPIVLSAYGNYAYVREAFVLGAFDYIVKADMDEEHILPVMRKALSALAGTATASGTARREASDDENQRQQREDWLRWLLTTDPEQAKGDFEQLLSEGTLWTSNLSVAVLQLADAANEAERQGFVRQTVESVLVSAGACHSVCRMGDGAYALLFSFPEDRSSAGLREKLHALLMTVMARLASYANVETAIGISGQGQGVKQWHRMYAQAQRLAELRYYEGYGKLLSHDAYGSLIATGEERDGSWQERASGSREAVMRALKHADGAAWASPFRQLRQTLAASKAQRPAATQAFLVDMLWELGSFLYARGRRWEELGAGYSEPSDVIRPCKTLEEALLAVERIVAGIYAIVNESASKPGARYSEPIAFAKSWLDAHYREEINQSRVSELAGVSESYLSKQFAKEVGSNFLHYLTTLRIEEAKRLLGQGVRIADVSERVGYANPEHFSRLFKRMTGLSPKGYRKDQFEQA
ncbi:response regulator transcription factor [Cohnella nanjingensis]|uniref:Helix-turn-helix domain-containing protein n=1 Tax=Cohnella nanjingensis TaxID=1387779 RepID=A0A7X0RPS2_9BACL|nr:helix-turn-helix domain-containing protein [Cohnella nanjingensis]MBB6671417.1 helix-turn-helix domain-containing protein [Cohnella nanjingensis]